MSRRVYNFFFKWFQLLILASILVSQNAEMDKKGKIILSLLLLFWTANTYPCTCVEVRESLGKKVSRAFDSNDLIFAGIVIDKEIRATEFDIPRLELKQPYIRAIIKFNVIDLIKGNIEQRELEIITPDDGGGCGIDFKVGKEYLVYSIESEYRFTPNEYLTKEKVKPFFATSLCTRTSILEKVSNREIKKLVRLSNRHTVS